MERFGLGGPPYCDCPKCADPDVTGSRGPLEVVTMRGLRGLFGVALLLLVLPASVTTAGQGPGDAATGGGWRLRLNGDRHVEFQLDAHSDADGANARGTYFLRSADGVVSFTADVTCLRVTGSVAVIGGRITESQNLGNGVGLLLWVSDGGAPSGGQPGPDQVTFSLVSPDDPLWPEGVDDVPSVCPSTDLPASVDWRAVEGSINVRDR